MVQRHKQCSTAYCLRHKSQNADLSCRFNYPKDNCDKTHLEFEQIHSKGSDNHYKVTVVTKRNDNCVNNHQRLQLQAWRANCDIQPSKSNRMSSVTKSAMISVLCEPNTLQNGAEPVKKVMMRAIGQRDMSIQEVMHQLLSIKLLSSSFQVITASLDGCRKLDVFKATN